MKRPFHRWPQLLIIFFLFFLSIAIRLLIASQQNFVVTVVVFAITMVVLRKTIIRGDEWRYLRNAFDYFVPLGYSIGKVTPLGIEFYPEWSPELESFREANFIAVGEALKGAFLRIEWWNA